MIIAITGGNGFIGSHIAKMIDEMGHQVIFISRDAKNAKNYNKYTKKDPKKNPNIKQYS